MSSNKLPSRFDNYQANRDINPSHASDAWKRRIRMEGEEPSILQLRREEIMRKQEAFRTGDIRPAGIFSPREAMTLNQPEIIDKSNGAGSHMKIREFNISSSSNLKN